MARSIRLRNTLLVALAGGLGFALAMLLFSEKEVPGGSQDAVAADRHLMAGMPADVAAQPNPNVSRSMPPEGQRHSGPSANQGTSGGAARPYDPVALLIEGHRAPSLFAQESRDAEWAPKMEARIEPQLAADLAVLGEETRLDSTECRKNICKITISGPSTASRGIAILTQGLARSDIADLGNMTVKDNHATHEVFMVFDKENRRTDDEADRSYEQKRAQELSKWRQANPGELPFAPPEN